MIGEALDRLIGIFSPAALVRRSHARRISRSYQGAEQRPTSHNRNPKNHSADQEMVGPFGADKLRAWGRSLVRDNAYAWGVVDTIVSSVVGCGIKCQSIFETPEGDDIEDVNDQRDKKWAEWCKVCEINGQYTFEELQAICKREMVEAGEVLIRKIKTPSTTHRGIYRPVPFALEIIEADRLAGDKDNYTARIAADGDNRIVRGVELDRYGKPVAYWIYADHPLAPYAFTRTPERIPADEIIHLFRRDRVGQTRGVTWFAPVMTDIRDIGVYIDNELQASAIASCFTAFIKSDSPLGSLIDPSGAESTDDAGNNLDYLQPGIITRLKTNESIDFANPGRPNSASEPWISLILRGIAVGTGLSYEIVARDYSKTNYSASRTSQLEDRRRFRRWQSYLVNNLCQPVRDAFADAAALGGLDAFATSADLLDDRRKHDPVEWQTPEWEWVDPSVEQAAAKDSITSFMSDYQTELGSRGRSWRAVFYQRAKEEKLRKQLGLLTPEEVTANMMAAQTASNAPAATGEATANVASQALNGAQVTSLVDVITQVGTGAMPKETAKPVLAAAFPAFSPELIDSIIDPIMPGSIAADGVPSAAGPIGADGTAAPSGVYMGLSTQQWNRNRKAIQKTLDEFAAGTMGEATARVFLASVGMPEADINILITDAGDGSLETQLPADEVTANV